MISRAVSAENKVPREMEFRAVLADFHGRDVLIAAGAGVEKCC